MDCPALTVNLRFRGQSMDRLRKARIFMDEDSLATRPRNDGLVQTVCACAKCPLILGDIVKLQFFSIQIVRIRSEVRFEDKQNG